MFGSSYLICFLPSPGAPCVYIYIKAYIYSPHETIDLPFMYVSAVLLLPVTAGSLPH